MSGSNTKSSSSSVLILHNTAIVTMDSQSRVFLNGAIVIEDDIIKAIGHCHHILAQFSSLSPQLIDLNGQFLLPGQNVNHGIFIYFFFLAELNLGNFYVRISGINVSG